MPFTLSSASIFVPINAVQRQPDGRNFVWVIDTQNTAHRSVVTVGQTLGNRIAIVDGLSIGDRVVTNGNQKLSEGSQVVY